MLSAVLFLGKAMNAEDIIRMATEAGIDDWWDSGNEQRETLQEHLERFAAFVAAHIRETEFKPDWNNYRQGFADGVAEEREACAEICDTYDAMLWDDEGEHMTGLGDKIRNRKD